MEIANTDAWFDEEASTVGPNSEPLDSLSHPLVGMFKEMLKSEKRSEKTGIGALAEQVHGYSTITIQSAGGAWLVKRLLT